MWMRALLTALVGTGVVLPLQSQSFPNGAPATWPVASGLPDESRQFDFWVGEWDVNLRVLQDDLTWRDTHRAVAHIYPILSGKAVLELWDAPAIKGYSLRYFDTHEDRWVLWLNWPGRNRAGSSSLQGGFRHGRGDFYSTRRGADGIETLSRYSFNDITPTSLRWDDAFSQDGGRTWTHSWIMEWSRTAAVPRLAAEGGDAHTWVRGALCDDDRFRLYEFLRGRRGGTLSDGGPELPSELTGYRVLDGCAVLAFIGDGGGTRTAEIFAHITWNTYASRYELTLLDDAPDTPARVLYTGENAGALVFTDRPGEDGVPTRRVRIEPGSDGGVSWTEEVREAGVWTPVRRGGFGPPR